MSHRTEKTIPHARGTALAGALGLALAAAPLAAGAAEGAKVSVGLGAYYLSGDYGSSAGDTDIWYVPLSMRWKAQRWRIKATVPWVRVTGPGAAVPGVGGVSRGATGRTSESGLGDVLLSASWLALYDRASRTGLRLKGKLKLDTADERKGLGTGSTDFTAAVEGFRSLGAATVFGSIGYRWMGDSDVYDLQNAWLGTAGFQNRLTHRTSAGLSVYLRQKISRTGAPRRELNGFVTHKLTDTVRLQGYGIVGFADGSPDWGLGANVRVDME